MHAGQNQQVRSTATLSSTLMPFSLRCLPCSQHKALDVASSQVASIYGSLHIEDAALI